MDGSTAVADRHTTITGLHADVVRAAERCRGVFVSRASRVRLAEALAAEREALTELGFDSYSAYMCSTAEAHDGTWTPDQLLFLAGDAGDAGDTATGDTDLDIDAHDHHRYAELEALNDASAPWVVDRDRDTDDGDHGDHDDHDDALEARFAAAHVAARDLTRAIASARRDARTTRSELVSELRDVAARLDALAAEAASLAEELVA